VYSHQSLSYPSCTCFSRTEHRFSQYLIEGRLFGLVRLIRLIRLFAAKPNSPVFILHFLLNISQILGCNITFQILGQRLRCRLQVLLIILEYHGLIVLFQVIRKHVCVHESLAALAKYVDSLFQKLHLELQEFG